MELKPLQAADFKTPAICLSGVVDYDMYKKFMPRPILTWWLWNCPPWAATRRWRA
jgi:hypothetical protein